MTTCNITTEQSFDCNSTSVKYEGKPNLLTLKLNIHTAFEKLLALKFVEFSFITYIF